MSYNQHKKKNPEEVKSKLLKFRVTEKKKEELVDKSKEEGFDNFSEWAIYKLSN